MAEAAAPAVGGAGLAGLFSSCIECFDCVQTARSFGEDSEGDTVGIVGKDEDEAAKSLENTLASLEDRKEKPSSGHGASSLGEPRTEKITDDDLQDEFNIVIHKQKGASTRKKVTWVVYRKKQFTGLVQNLSALVSALVDIVPNKSQGSFCKNETAGFTGAELNDLRTILNELGGNTISNQLREAVAEHLGVRAENKRTTDFENNPIGEGSNVHHGNEIAKDDQGQVLPGTSSLRMKDSEMGKNVNFSVNDKYGFKKDGTWGADV